MASQQLKNRIQKLQRSGNLKAAINTYSDALNKTPGDPEIHYGLGMLLGQINRAKDALQYLRKANELLPGNAEILHGLAATHLSLGQRDVAIPFLQKALEIRPDFTVYHQLLGNIYLNSGKPASAIKHYDRALEKNPGQLDLLINLATACELARQTDRCKELATSILSTNPDNPSANLLLARIEKRSGEYLKAEKRIKIILETKQHPQIAATANTLLGQLLDVTERYSEAFTAFGRANHIRKELLKHVPCDESYYLKLISHNKALFKDRTAIDQGHVMPADSINTPVFFVGFPRSGTTLVEQILNAHPNILSVDEKPIIDNLIREYAHLPEQAVPVPKNASQLSQDDILHLRKRYFELIHAETGPLQEGIRIVDKLALNIVQIGFINRIFPEAKVIVALRDPRDCCLSAFMQEFRPSPATLHFLSMDSTARLYDEVMSLWFDLRDALDINYLEYRYEDLVADPEGIARKLLAFIGEEWNSCVLNYHQTAKTRQISTPSYQDVTKPIYSGSIGRWKHYQKNIVNVLPVLEKHVNCLGYSQT